MKSDRCYVHMMTDGGTHHLHFWCDLYNPQRMYYPKEKYIKGEEICMKCSFHVAGVTYRAAFQCTREATPTYLARFTVPRHTMFKWNNTHPEDIPVKEQKKFLELFRWLHGGEIETKRKPAKKIAKASKERTDLHGSGTGASAGFLQSDPIREEVTSIAAKVKQPQGEPTGCNECIQSTSGAGLQGLLEEAHLLDNDYAVPGEVYGTQVQKVRSNGGVQDNRIREVGVVPGLQEDTMKEEYDESYEQTTAHSCITCKCGTKVWYGCGVKQITRPKYCKACEKKEQARITASYKGKVDSSELHRIIEWELRRGINR